MIVEINGRKYWVSSEIHEQQLRQRMNQSNEVWEKALDGKPKPPRGAGRAVDGVRREL
jgi:hypothetical protein